MYASLMTSIMTGRGSASISTSASSKYDAFGDGVFWTAFVPLPVFGVDGTKVITSSDDGEEKLFSSLKGRLNTPLSEALPLVTVTCGCSGGVGGCAASLVVVLMLSLLLEDVKDSWSRMDEASLSLGFGGGDLGSPFFLPLRLVTSLKPSGLVKFELELGDPESLVIPFNDI
jgi:hypothetical protein